MTRQRIQRCTGHSPLSLVKGSILHNYNSMAFEIHSWMCIFLLYRQLARCEMHGSRARTVPLSRLTPFARLTVILTPGSIIRRIRKGNNMLHDMTRVQSTLLYDGGAEGYRLRLCPAHSYKSGCLSDYIVSLCHYRNLVVPSEPCLHRRIFPNILLFRLTQGSTWPTSR